MQVRLATPVTSEDYITGKLWSKATIVGCPWHPEGGCGFARHGTYRRVKPADTHIARWYCRRARRTVSALPDCLSSHRSGTLDECEAFVRATQNASSIEAACRDCRTDIELPGAMRYLVRLRLDITQALQAIKGLFPLRFHGQPTLSDFTAQLTPLDGLPGVLMQLREIASSYLPQLPTPLGFNSRSISDVNPPSSLQQRMGHDPPNAFIDPCV